MLSERIMKRRNLILEETIHVEYFTYLRDVFKAVSELEIVCWDSTCTLFIGCSEKIARILEKTYPDIEDLIKHNRKLG